MRKIFTTSLCAALALCAWAGVPKGMHSPKYQHDNGRVIEGAQLSHHLDLSSRALSDKSVAKAQSRGFEDDDPIYDVEGDEQSYIVSAVRFQDTMFGLIYNEATAPGNVVWGENNKVYIRDIISSCQSGIYVEGEVVDGRIRVQLPQICYFEESETDCYFFYATKMEFITYQKEGKNYFDYRTVVQEDDCVYYDICDDGSLMLALNDEPVDLDAYPQYIIGICIDPTEGVQDWYGNGDAYQTYQPAELNAQTVPDGVELEQWVMISSEQKGTAMVGFADGNVYITEFSSVMPEATIIGHIDGDKVTFATPQYLGSSFGDLVYLMACEWTSEEWEDYFMLDELVMNYDAEAKVISVDNPLIDLLLNLNESDADPIDYLTDVTFRYQADGDDNAAPQNPFVQFFDPYQYRDWLGDSEGYIDWVIPSSNVNGFMLDTENMYYNFYAGGELFTFTTDVYTEFDADYTDVPYDYTDGWDLQVLDESHYITFKQPFTKFGLQSFYIGSDGNLYASDLVAYPKGTEGIDNIFAGKEVERVEFYNLQGQRVVRPVSGIYLMRTICADGTSSTRKIKK